MSNLEQIGQKAAAAKFELQTLSTEKKDKALRAKPKLCKKEEMKYLNPMQRI